MSKRRDAIAPSGDGSARAQRQLIAPLAVVPETIRHSRAVPGRDRRAELLKPAMYVKHWKLPPFLVCPRRSEMRDQLDPERAGIVVVDLVPRDHWRN